MEALGDSVTDNTIVTLQVEGGDSFIDEETLDNRHESIIEIVSMYFDVAEEVLTQEIELNAKQKSLFIDFTDMDDNDYICFLKKFETSATVRFDLKPPEARVQGEQTKILKKEQEKLRLKIILTKTFQIPIERAVFVCKISEDKSNDKYYYSVIPTLKDDIPAVLLSLIESIWLPAIEAEKWDRENIEEEDKLSFLDDIYDFLRKLETISTCLCELITLTPCSLFQKEWDFEELQAAAQGLETMGSIEECTAVWMRQIKTEIQHAELIYIEKENFGPHSEVRYWKQRMTRFNSLIMELRNKTVQSTLTILKLGKSKTLDLWFELDKQITHVYNEAKENSKFLQAIETTCLPLYRRDIEQMTKAIPNLLSILRLIYVHSTYYKKFAYMTILISKISNQIISSSKNYITNNNTQTIWEQDIDKVIIKMQNCKNLKQTFQECYRSTKAKMEEDKDDKIFDFSEIQIFGHLNHFSKRLDELIFILKSTKTYKSLEHVVLEGKEVLLNDLKKLLSNIHNKKYDFLNHNNPDFPTDYLEFQKSVNAIHEKLLEIISKLFSKAKSVIAGLRLQEKLGGIQIPNLNHAERYRLLFHSFRSEIEEIGLVYMNKRNEPPMERNMPPIYGKMLWARLLFDKLEEPLLYFKTMAPEVFGTREGQKIIARYNRVVQTLVTYEILHYRAWRKLIKIRLQGFRASLLVLSRAEPYPNLYVNIDPDILTLFRELKCIEKALCPIPFYIEHIKFLMPTIINNHMNLKYLCDTYYRLLTQINNQYEKLFAIKFYHLQLSLQPGLVIHDWTSSNIQSFVDKNLKFIEDWLDLMYKVDNIREFGVENRLTDISKQRFITIPVYQEANPSLVYNIHEFVQAVMIESRETALFINHLTNIAFGSAQKLLDLMLVEFDDFLMRCERNGVFTDDAQKHSISGMGIDSRLSAKHLQEISKTRKLIHKIKMSSDDLIKFFGQKAVEAVVKSIRSSLYDYFRVLTTKDAATELKRFPEMKSVIAKHIDKQPLFQTEICIIGNKFIMKPTLDEIQSCIKQSIILIQNNTKGILKWMDLGRLAEKNRKLYTRSNSVISKANSADERPRSHSVSSISKVNKQHVTIDTSDNTVKSDSDSTTPPMLRTSSIEGKMPNKFFPSGSNLLPRSLLETVNMEFQELETNCFGDIRMDREIYRMNSCILAWSTSVRFIIFEKNGVIRELDNPQQFVENFIHLWNKEPKDEVDEFVEHTPSLFEYQTRLADLTKDEEDMNATPDFVVVGPLEINLINFKATVLNRIIQFKTKYMNACLQAYVNKVEKIQLEIEDLDRAFKKPLTTLDDISFAMETKKKLIEKEINIDMHILAAEEGVAVLSNYNLPLPRDLLEKVESSRTNFTRLIEKGNSVMNTILNIQGRYKKELVFNTKSLKKAMEIFVEDYNKSGPMLPGLTPQQALDKHIFFKNRFDNITKKAESYNKGEKLFGLPLTDSSMVQKIGKELDLLQKLYGLYDEVNRAVARYYDIPWKYVNMEDISTELKDFQMKCKRLPKGLKEWPAYTELQKTLDDFIAKTPLLELMTNKAMKPRHWQRMTDLLDYKFDIELETFNLKMMLDAPLLKDRDSVEDICVSAEREKDIENKLYGIINDWVVQELKFSGFKNRGEMLLKGDKIAELQALLEDSLMVLNSLSNNRYNMPFRSLILEWLHKLSTTAEVLDLWLRVQNLWVYLEAVFVGGDIAKQMPVEAKRFQSIDRTWMKIMERARDVVNVVQCCASDQSLLELLPRLLDQLELCQKSLSGYLEKKRLAFPRFFFVSDTVLLEILGKASDTHSIQPYLLSIFDNSKTAEFNEKMYDVIEGVYSSEGEYLLFDKLVRCEGHVETWLSSLLNEMQHSLFLVIKHSYFQILNADCELISFLKVSLAQIGILTLQIIWTNDASEALRESRYDSRIMQRTHKQFVSMLNQLINETTRDLTKYERTKFETLITIHVHQRDIFEEVYRSGIRSTADFDWTKQIRVYFMEELEKCILSLTDVGFVYQNEFLGCTERLVITPLTDRCYITLAQAINMGLGGAPAGPAGTGKTETTKDMGRCLGKYVVVFNCSDQMDFRGLGRIFKGLAQSGTWGCFDEFNRIELPVLSVAAQQIAIILQCRREGQTKFIFSDGDVVDMNFEFGIFLTMNPGYAGRQELPENLKINFRSVAMMVPDRQIIIRVKLAACGYVDNIILARKFFVLYKLCEEQLTKQVHYDFGLRNILSVLRTLGAARRAASNSNEPEEKTVMRVLRDMNLSKLVDKDEPLFLSLINDLFPSITLDKSGYPKLEAAINRNVDAMNLMCHPPWILKIIQLYETQMVRHGMMTLGPTGAGKSCCIAVLMQSLTNLRKPHKELRMNPKAITAAEMFGKLDVATNDWTDGIFSTLWRRTTQMYRSSPDQYCWLVLDGPVDAIWIENLNSVLDDNKTLTLANGDRISMSPTCKIVFEVHNIDNASPATVSRNGMVFMSSSALNWEPIFKAWMKTATVPFKDKMWAVLSTVFDPTYKFVTENLVLKMPILECFIVHQICSLMSGLVGTNEIKSEQYMLRLLCFSIMWSFGAVLELDDRLKLDQELRKIKSIKSLFPVLLREGDTYDYTIQSTGDWCHWELMIEEYIYPKDYTPVYSTLLIPNVDNVRMDFLIRTIANQGLGVLLIGEPGTAKTVMINNFASSYNPEKHLFKVINFSSATTPVIFQKAIESFVDKRVGSTFGPPNGRKMTIFIDDINLPKINEWGDQIANEIVRQTIEMKGFYCLEKPGDFKSILDLQFIGAMIHPGGGRNDIPERLKRHFHIFNCTLPAYSSIDRIFSMIGLGHYCREREFSDDIIYMVTKLVPLTRKLWLSTKNKMKPTPAKFHYIFNLRDLSRIWQGLINTKAEVIKKPKTLIKLWIHECTRVLADRFVIKADIHWYKRHLELLFEEPSIEEFRSILTDEETYFADFLRDAPEATGDEPDDADFSMPRIYEPISSLESFRERLIMFNHQYNESIRGSPINLIFFTDAMTHIVKISRVIRLEQGNMLLVGVGGSGKRSLTHLATFIADYVCYKITITRIYNLSNYLEDLKEVYKIAGKEGKGVVFLFTDAEIKNEYFLEYINNMLSSGMIPGLFSKEENDEIISSLTYAMKKQNSKAVQTPETLYQFFLDRVRANLHVVLSFSPVGEKFRQRALYFPSLISGCTINWFQKWPTEALIAVAKHNLETFPMVCESFVRNQVIETMAGVHVDVSRRCKEYLIQMRRSVQVTQKSYFSYIEMYKNLYEDIKSKISNLNDRMKNGLLKLKEAQESIVVLSQELEVKEKNLLVANAEAEAVLVNVTKQTNAAQTVKNKVKTVKDKCEKIVENINIDFKKAEEKLIAAEPAMREATEALNTIKPNDITTVRKLQKPPHLIQRIMDCVLILFKKKIDSVTPDHDRKMLKPSWTESLKLLASTKFLENLLMFQRDLINEETVELLEPYFSQPDYNLESAKKSCGNVAGLCSWTKAMEKYFWVNNEVIPLKDNLKSQQIILDRAKADLEVAEGMLAEKEEILNAVKAEYDKAIQRKQALENDAQACKKKMNTAKQLMSGLKDEKERWTTQSIMFEEQIGLLVGDIIVIAAFVSYCGAFNQQFRKKMSAGWENMVRRISIPISRTIDIVDRLCNPNQISEWTLHGLPNDRLSIENAIVVTQSLRYPLLVDPQSQGKNWIKAKEGSQVAFTSLSNKYFQQHLEDALNNGQSLIIEDVLEELDPALDNILEKNFIKMGRGLKVKVGDKEVEVHQNFKLFITTKISNPNFPPEVCAKVAVIDFSVTMKGLEDQLLSIVINIEKQELETSRNDLLVETNANKKIVKELEDNLLERLANTEGSLVDDTNLLTVLTKAKSTSIAVSRQIAQSAETEWEIERARDEYRPVARRGSLLYFLITELSSVNPMYQNGLRQFLNLFIQGINTAESSPFIARRISHIITSLTNLIWNFVVRSLFKVDRTTFTLFLALKVDMSHGAVRQEEFNIFLKGGSSLDIKTVQNKNIRWIIDIIWLNLVALSNLTVFSGLLEHITSSEKQWRSWFDKEAPEDEIIPCGYDAMLDEFKKLLLIRCWCPDRTLNVAKRYIQRTLGSQYIEEVPFNIKKLLMESNCTTPLLGLLSVGADPTPFIEQYTRRHQISITTISMGQGQEVHARRAITNAMQNGEWVLLQNCHLCITYVNELFFIISTMAAELAALAAETASNVNQPPLTAAQRQTQAAYNPNFRLWMTSEEHESFPINFLQISIKFTNEPPQGIRANLMRSFADLTQDYMDSFVTIHWKIMYYSLAFLHCIVQERRRFGPLGWNIPYEFNQADFSASNIFMQNHLDGITFKKSQKTSGIDWKCVRYMISEIQYGGRVTDDFDLRLLLILCRWHFQEEMFLPDFKLNVMEPLVVQNTVEDYKKYIHQLPSIDRPGSFGLHSNADISYSTKTTKHILETIIAMNPKDSESSSSGGGGSNPSGGKLDAAMEDGGSVTETRESIVSRKCTEMLDKLPSSLAPHLIQESIQKMPGGGGIPGLNTGTPILLQPMNIFLRQELDRINRVIVKVRITLTDLRLAIEGVVVMNDDLRLALDSIFDARIPSIWEKISWESASLGFWFRELIDRNYQFMNWLEKGRPLCFWLTGLFNPQGFLTAMRQEITRSHDGWALDNVVLSNRVTRLYSEDLKESPKEGVFVYGLYLEGAAWDKRNGRLVEARPKILYDSMPIINMFAIQESIKRRIEESEKIYISPLYKKPRRTNLTYVSNVELPCSKTNEHWIVRGVALLCDIK